MLVYILTFLAGAGAGFVACNVAARSRQQKLEADIIRCQAIINSLTVTGGPMRPADGEVFPEGSNSLEISDVAVKRIANIPDIDDNLLTRVKAITESHIADEDFGVDQLCRELAMSRMQLNRKLKKIINSSPNQLILDIRMKYAASLLSDSRLNVGEVAFRLGFSSHSYFSSKFKEYFGVTPSEYVARDSAQPTSSKDDKGAE